MHDYLREDLTIAAIATPPGEGGVAIIRISGKRAIEIANKIISLDLFSLESHRAYLGKIVDQEGKMIDEGLILVMKGPKSYTGEDTVEIQGHGGSLISNLVLKRAFEAGAHPALAGEFTQRAFLNGKIDLTQAESIQMLIHAKNERALKAAKDHLEGALFRKVSLFQETLFRFSSIMEAGVDYPEEGLEFISEEEMKKELKAIREEMDKLAKTFEEGKRLQTGYKMALIGAPNVGKSSLLNALLGKDRAIVTEIPGTTRDILEEEVIIEGFHFHLIDTAGIRETDERIEQEGIRKSKKALDTADLILFVADGSCHLTKEEEDLVKILPNEKTIAIINKMDLFLQLNLETLPFSQVVLVSALHMKQLDKLKQTIVSVIKKGGDLFSKNEVLLTKERHFLALSKAIESIDKVLAGMEKELFHELLSIDLRDALEHLSEMIGKNVTEEILSEIFKNFCVGK